MSSDLDVLRCAAQLSRMTAREVVCPECGAQPSERCIGLRGYRESNHKSRAIARARQILSGRANSVPGDAVNQQAEVQFTCDICGGPVRLNEGLVHHSLRDETLERPISPLLWRLGHEHCFDDIPEDYSFPLRQFANVEAALRWNVHLAEKTWFDAYDWASFVERHFVRKAA